MYYRDHDPPHVHVWYAGYEGTLRLASEEVLTGGIPPRALALVREWMRLHTATLEENWRLARDHQPLQPIQPLAYPDQSRNSPRVVAVENPRDYILRVTFSDGRAGEVDMAPELWGPVFESLRDPALFGAACVDRQLGTVVWPNGADLDPDQLWRDVQSMAS